MSLKDLGEIQEHQLNSELALEELRFVGVPGQAQSQCMIDSAFWIESENVEEFVLRLGDLLNEFKPSAVIREIIEGVNGEQQLDIFYSKEGNQ